MKSMIRDQCVVCDSKKIEDIIDLGMHPFADTFVPADKLSEPDFVYPLVCSLCTECGHVQNKFETNPMQRYSQIEYSYTSSNSQFARTHWEKYAEEMSKDLNLDNAFVVEAGSNDGYLAEQFLKKGNKVLGIDPSPYMADLAEQRNVPTIVGLFGTKHVKEILDKYGKADLFVANNVFNHSDNPGDFTKAVAEILKDDGVFVFEQPYWIETLRTGKFDQIYHEHVSYYTVRSAKKLLERSGLMIKSANVVNYHGGSLRIIAMKKGKTKENEKVKELIQQEEKYGAFSVQTYRDFMIKLNYQRSKFMEMIHQLKEKNTPLIAVGAAAKGNTFLNFYGLDSTIIDYVTDASLHKKGKYTPLSRIPIVGDEIFSKYGEVYAIILSWNIADQLKEILSKYNKQIVFISPDSKMNIKDLIHQKRGIDHEDERRTIMTAFNGDLKGFKAEQVKIYEIKQERKLAGCYHDYIVVFYILEGEVKFVVEDVKTKERKEYVLTKTDVLLIPSYVAYQAFAKAGTKMLGFTEVPFVSSEKNDVKYEF